MDRRNRGNPQYPGHAGIGRAILGRIRGAVRDDG